jgi:hypothetical protein
VEKVNQGIDAAVAAVSWLTKRIRAGKVDLAHAREREQHFLEQGQAAHKDFERAEKAGDQAGKRKAKRATRRASRKHAYWLEQVDDIEAGLREAVRRKRRRRKKLRALRRIHDQMQNATSGNGRVVFDGKPCADWLAHDLGVARSHGLWSGVVVSGVRTSAQSVALCWAMCHAPSCPGRCAGTASNHNCDDCHFPRGAADVSDYYRCKSASAILGLRYTNALPIDPVHMSHDGH